MKRPPTLLLGIAALSCLLAAASCARKGSVDTTRITVEQMRSALDARLTELEKHGFCGVVRVDVKGELAYARGLGHADCAATEAMTPDDVFLIGSITKEFLRLLAYKLEEEGHLRMDDPIGTFLPDLPEDKAALTVRQIVTHTAGIPDLVDASGRPVEYTVAYDYEPVSKEQMLNRFGKAALIFKPGTREEYSNLGYQVLAAVYEAATKERIEDILRTRIFEPAGMAHTGWIRPDWSSVRFAEGCLEDGSRWGSPLLDGMWMEDGPSWNLRGAGGLLGSAEDLSRFMDALHRGILLKPETQARYLDDRLVNMRRYGERGMGPAGSNGIFNAVFFWLEKSDFRFVILSSHADQIGEDYARELIHLTARAR